MAYLSELEVSDLRSWERVKLSPSPCINAIMGANGAGKTNLLEAIGLLAPGRTLRNAPASTLSRNGSDRYWRVNAEVEPEGLEISLTGGLHSPRQARLYEKHISLLSIAESLPILWLTPAMDRLWVEAREQRRRFLDRLVMNHIPNHGKNAQIYERSMRERNRLLKDGVLNSHWLDALEQEMAESGAAINRDRARILQRINAIFREVKTSFPVASLALTGDKIIHQMQDSSELIIALVNSRKLDAQAGRCLIGAHRCDLEAIYEVKNMPAAQCSTGEQKALLVSIILANARAIAAKNGKTPILLLDEVSAHLDPARRAELYQELNSLGGQCFLTGTEHALFEALPEGSHTYLVEDKEGQSALHLKP